MSMTKLAVCLIALVGCLFAYACNNSPASNAPNVAIVNTSSTTQPKTTVSNDDLAKGRDLYNKNCSNCHKESGEGGPTVVDGRKMKPDNLTDARRTRMSDDKYLETMVKGIEDEGMPSYKDKLSEAEMREIVRYVRVGLQKQPDNPPANANTH
jgi:mono/diheme cytochrome c family protein